MSLERCWEGVEGSALRQGDLLRDCHVPILTPAYPATEDEMTLVALFDLIVVTQSCDFEPSPPRFVLLAEIWPVRVFEQANPDFGRKGVWEEARKERRPGLYLLPSPDSPRDPWAALVVDFRNLYSLPHPYIARHAEELGARSRLTSPWLEHYAQSFARYFMRVGLPESLPSFK